VSKKLENNNIMCNYRAILDGEGFTAFGALRLWVSEMARFGIEAANLQKIAQLIKENKK